MDDVDEGKVKLPKQEVPPLKVMEQQEKKIKSGTKSYTADLVKVSGKKGSNEGGLFRDKKLDTLHYVKWPNSPARAKVEALTALLYAYAKVPVPTVRVIKFQGKDAVMSDWIEDAKTMTWDEITKHKDVRAGFAADAWLANWDVVGLQADNLVKGPGNKAYRIDVGGSMLFRAQGKPKGFPANVPELETMRNPSIAPQASKAFQKLTPTQLRNGVKKVAAVTDAQIDFAVDSVKLPKKSADYPAKQFGKEANDLPKMLKARLKARRDWLRRGGAGGGEEAGGVERAAGGDGGQAAADVRTESSQRQGYRQQGLELPGNQPRGKVQVGAHRPGNAQGAGEDGRRRRIGADATALGRLEGLFHQRKGSGAALGRRRHVR